MLRAKTSQISFYGNHIYDRIIPKDHFLKLLDKAVDFSFVNELCRDAYTLDFGRPAYKPEMMFKIIFLQFLYDVSDRRIEGEVNFNLVLKWFVGLAIDESPPDSSSLTRFRDRMGEERFANIFNQIVEIARGKGLVSDRLSIVDSTDVKAKVDTFKIKDNPDASPDKDARHGYKSEKKPFFGYKAHASMDSDSDLITKLDTTPGNASRDELIGRSIVTLVATKDHARIMEDMGNTLNTGFTRGLYYDFLTTDGVPFPIRLSMALLKNPLNKPRGFVVVAEDVSESRKMEEQLQHSQLLASLGEMTAGIAHEVNNPLATVMLYSEILMDSEAPREINRDLRIIHDEVKRAAQIMTNLLTYSRQSTSRVRPLNLNKILRKVTEMRRYTQTVQNITVDVDLPEESITVRGNAHQLTQVFMNLMVNAEEAVLEGEDRTIVITARIDGDWVKVSVADTGTGIPEENFGQVFYPFFSTKRNRKGTGLGLSICYGIVTEHGGLIHVENNPMGGATFSVELPLSTSQKKASLPGREYRRLPNHYPHGRPGSLSPSSSEHADLPTGIRLQ